MGGLVSGVVVDLAGTVMARFPAGGGERLMDPETVVWDGRHANRVVPPGLYWIRVHSPRGTRSIGVAVIDGDCGN
jgi:hypothetical protein